MMGEKGAEEGSTAPDLSAGPGVAVAPPPASGPSQFIAAGLARLLMLRQSTGGRKAARAGAWVAGGYGVSTALRFVSRLVLAKLVISAAPMGDVATIVVILAGLEMVSDLGIGFGIVQHHKADDDAYLGTAFSVQALRGVALWLIASALAQPVAWIYHAPELRALLLFGALSTLFKAFAKPSVWLFTRGVDLRLPTILGIGAEIVGFVVTVCWAIANPSAWAIVGGSVASAAAYAIGSHFLGRRLAFAWSKDMAREIIHFGGWMLLSSATYFLSSRGESLMLRGAVPDVEFGCFAFATMLVSTPVAAITQMATQVFFPMLAASMRDDRERAIRQYWRGKWAFTGLAVCFVWGAAFVAPPILALLKLPKTFDGLRWMVPLLGIRAALDIFGSPTANVLFAAGSPRYASWANLVRLVVLMIGLYLTVGHWGLRGAIWVLIGAPALSYLAFLPGVHARIRGSLRVEFATFFVFWTAAAAALALWEYVSPFAR
jgi:O-antigen/teichoic acid export membrane protein